MLTREAHDASEVPVIGGKFVAVSGEKDTTPIDVEVLIPRVHTQTDHTDRTPPEALVKKVVKRDFDLDDHRFGGGFGHGFGMPMGGFGGMHMNPMMGYGRPFFGGSSHGSMEHFGK